MLGSVREATWLWEATRPTIFGQQLRQLRAAAGLTQEVLVERSGVSVDAISALENGRRHRPRPDTVLMLAEGLGLGSRSASV
jgi:transcriptional regulator with XRE-family HTH domain